MSSTATPRAYRALAAVGALLAGACADASGPLLGSPTSGTATAHLHYSTDRLRAGERLAVSLRIGASAPLAGMQAVLHFDASRLRYVGVAEHGGQLLAVNARDTSVGILRSATAHASGLSEVEQLFVFEGRRDGAVGALRAVVEEVIARDGAAFAVAAPVEVRRRADLAVPPAGALRRPASEPAFAVAGVPVAAALVGNGPFRYGDVNGSGSITVGDVLLVLNASVGNRTLVGDAFVVGNIAPTNLGSATLPPGTSADGSRMLTVADVVLLQRATVDNTTPVVGTTVPAARVGPRLIVTPMRPRVGTTTQACLTRVASGVPFADPAVGTPWPECIDPAGDPMVVQFCSYVKLASGDWLADGPSAAAARCRAELPVVQRGGV